MGGETCDVDIGGRRLIVPGGDLGKCVVELCRADISLSAGVGGSDGRCLISGNVDRREGRIWLLDSDFGESIWRGGKPALAGVSIVTGGLFIGLDCRLCLEGSREDK
jgi:hypothetical protein